jgi:uncharacterized membrane protein
MEQSRRACVICPVKRTLLISFVLFYVLAGTYHFVNPQFYLDLIPPYIPFPTAVNYLSGAIEISLGLLALSKAHRKWAAYGIMAMLIAFLPAHIYFIQIGSCVEDGLCVPEWVGWFRLIAIHPFLLRWAWRVSRIR